MMKAHFKSLSIRKVRIGAILLIAVFAEAIASADLVKEVEGLTPEQALKIEQLLMAKKLEPLPKSLFTDLAFVASLRTYSIAPKEFVDNLDNEFDSSFDYAAGGNLSFLWKVSDSWRIGLGYLSVRQSATKETSSGIFNNVELNLNSLQLMGSYQTNLSESWKLLALLGLGSATGEVQSNSSDDNAGTSYNYNFGGFAFAGSASVSALYALNPTLYLGFELGYQQTTIDELKRSFEREIDTPKDLNLSGPFAGLSFGVNL